MPTLKKSNGSKRSKLNRKNRKSSRKNKTQRGGRFDEFPINSKSDVITLLNNYTNPKFDYKLTKINLYDNNDNIIYSVDRSNYNINKLMVDDISIDITPISPSDFKNISKMSVAGF